MSNEHRPIEMEALQQLLDTHGSDRTRWPAPERLRFAALLQESAEARRLLNEAAALDRLLDLAPNASAPRLQALAGRVALAAFAEAQDRPTAAAVARPAFGAARGAPWRSHGAPMMSSPQWQAAGLLAASLMFGLVIGTGRMAPETVGPIAAALGIEEAVDVSLLNIDGEVAALSDEELL